MWKQFYSNSGLILLAMLTTGIWVHNLRELWPKHEDYSDFHDVTMPTPTRQLSIEEALRAIPLPTPPKSAEDTYAQVAELAKRDRRWLDYDELRNLKRHDATAVCADGTYSHLYDSGLACANHGHVARWLR
jgi:hypothetical protein